MLSFGSPMLYDSSQPAFTRQRQFSALIQEFHDVLCTIADIYVEDRAIFGTISFAFRAGTAMHRLLSPCYDRSKVESIRDYGDKIRERTQISTLLHIHCALLTSYHTDTTSRSDTFRNVTRHLRRVLQFEWIWRHSLSHLNYAVALNDDFKALVDANLSWKVMRLLNVIWWLSSETSLMVHDFLFRGLTKGPSISPDFAYPLDLVRIQEELQAYYTNLDNDHTRHVTTTLGRLALT